MQVSNGHVDSTSTPAQHNSIVVQRRRRPRRTSAAAATGHVNMNVRCAFSVVSYRSPTGLFIYLSKNSLCIHVRQYTVVTNTETYATRE